MLRRILPHPVLSLVLVAVWILLNNAFTVGAFALGIILGVLVPLFTSQFWPKAPRIRHPLLIAEYCLVVLWDIVVANLQVAYAIVFRRSDKLSPKFFTVPLDIHSPEAITVLAGTITMTPGTVSSDLSADGRSLLVHGLDVTDEAQAVAAIKKRYELRLKRIFG